MGLEDIFKATLEEYSLIKRKDRLILGVSGGPDSLCLLYQFCKLKDRYKLHLVCVHFNHGLREEADSEEKFIKEICAKLKIPFISERKEVKKFFKGDSLEQTARNLRFDFFLKCSRQTKIKKVALAHHKDDLIETVLMRLIRGAGLRGLRGFLPKSRFKSLTLIRPLIGVDKQEILNWLKKEKIAYCIDKSNFEEKFFRNRIRLKLLPLLKELNPNIVNSLYNISRSISLDYDLIYNLAYQHFSALKRRQSHNGLSLDLGGLKKLAPAIFYNVIRIAIEEIKGNVRKIEIRHLDEIRDLVWVRPSGSIVDIPLALVKKEEKLLLIQSAL